MVSLSICIKSPKLAGLGPAFSGGAGLLLLWMGRFACVCLWWVVPGAKSRHPFPIQAVKNSPNFYLWVSLSSQRTANRREAYSEKADVESSLPNRDSASSLSSEPLEGKLGWKQYDHFWFLITPHFVHSARRGLAAGQHKRKMFFIVRCKSVPTDLTAFSLSSATAEVGKEFQLGIKTLRQLL